MPHAIRTLAAAPLVSAAIIGSLAVAIGANTAVFSVVRSVLLNPLPYPDPDRLAILWTDDTSHDSRTEGVSYPNFADWRAMNRSFDDLAFFVRTDFLQTNITGGEIPERVQFALVSSNFFKVIGVQPARGRVFTEAEVAEKQRLVLISAGLAERRFGTVDAVGRTLDLDGKAATVVGVMPARFGFPTADTEIWKPYSDRLRYQDANRSGDALVVLGRLRQRTTVRDARVDMTRLGGELARAHPDMPSDFGGFGVNIVPLYEHIYGRSLRPALLLIGGIVVMVLLIASANAANLLLARLEARQQEFAIRAAVGANRADLARQLLTETGMLALAGAVLGIGLGYGGVFTMARLFAQNVPRMSEARIDLVVLGFAIAITGGACLLAGLGPLSTLAHNDFAQPLRWRGSRRLSSGLAVVQIALATSLAGGAVLFVESYRNVEQTKLGFNPDNLLAFELIARSSGHKDAAARDAYVAQLTRGTRERIQALPGVTGVAFTGELFARRNPDWQIFLEGRSETPNNAPLGDDLASANLFEVLGTPLIRGRVFTPEEEANAGRSVVIINQAMARHFWGDTDPIGKRFSFDSPTAPKRVWRSVIGVVGDMRIKTREAEPIPEFYTTFAAYPNPKVLVRTHRDPVRILAAIRDEVHRLDPGAVVYGAETASAHLARWSSQRRMNASIIGLFSSIATLIAAIGIFSLLHYAVVRRTSELGIRMALGARRSNVAVTVLRDTVRIALIGSIAGVIVTAMLARVFSWMLFGVKPFDPGAMAGSVAAVMVLAAVASLAPVVRAWRIDPAVSLRS